MDRTAEETLDVIAPELKNADDKSAHLELAEVRTGDVFGDVRPYAVALLAAHTLTLARRVEQAGSVGGPVQSMSEGSLSVSFGQATGAGKSELASTTYGERLIQLRRERIVGASTVVTLGR